jgi:hypothetical protein
VRPRHLRAERGSEAWRMTDRQIAAVKHGATTMKSFSDTKPAEIFDNSKCGTEAKLKNFSKYVRRHDIARFITQYELFKRILHIKGSVVECGVHHGGGVMAWAKLSETLEPYNYRRKIFGFDTFEGFPTVNDADLPGGVAKPGLFKESYDIFAELQSCIDDFNKTRPITHEDKVILVKGDANLTIPKFLDENQHVLVALLYLDFDIYEPTLTALKHFIPRMSKGAIVAFDEANNPNWPGETKALLESLELNDYTLESSPHEPNISWITL